MVIIMKNILLIGDSIRMNYQAKTAELFEGKANVYGPADNCRNTHWTLMNIEKWLKELPKPDIIQWNNGCWDITRFDTTENKPLTSLEVYVENTLRICRILKRTGAVLIFALSTPYHPVKQVKNKTNEDVWAYNKAVREALEKEGVIINDLNTPVWADYDKYICDDGCHLSDEGIELCAKQNYDLMLPLVEQKRVLLLGDSIRGNYQEAVKAELGKEYRVYHPTDNCRFTAYTLHLLRHWLPAVPKPDVVHWNNGIWDFGKYYGEEDSFTPLDEYVRNLKRIVNGIRYFYGEDQKIVFALTTPQNRPESWETYEKFNAAAREALEPMGIEINDLYTPLKADLDRYICDDKCHLSDEGKAYAGKLVADAIRKAWANIGSGEATGNTEDTVVI